MVLKNEKQQLQIIMQEILQKFIDTFFLIRLQRKIVKFSLNWKFQKV